MTGEITLRGNVLPIGGVKEKVFAARRARVTTIILPQQNRRDLDEVPKEPFKDIRFVFVDNMRQVFREALGERVVPPASPATETAASAAGRKRSACLSLIRSITSATLRRIVVRYLITNHSAELSFQGVFNE